MYQMRKEDLQDVLVAASIDYNNSIAQVEDRISLLNKDIPSFIPKTERDVSNWYKDITEEMFCHIKVAMMYNRDCSLLEKEIAAYENI